ncbi:MAG: NAD(P)-dependent oxidoreductase [Candidatus Omnitrophica bacterium]|nr:NAD(P)-dependent oxidoreductase [Candidatus Omnitrophota bacterium]MBI3021793.1 NAD(P)-dependent oxidoreductase [Candidatus Omnitrophota bacterium]MBI3083499.1 NAD(P)-dependent oxidoreductase [Candidatus Omnitrophota bacterium]
MRVVVTGSESFIGRELRRHGQAKQIEWVGLDTAPADDPGHIQIDIRSPELADVIPEGLDAVVHLAAISRDQDCRANPQQAFDVNVSGTLNVIRAARERNARQFIFASSEWVYGDVSSDAVQTEDQPIAVTGIRSEYALSKLVGEQVLRMAFAQGLCPVTVLRFGIVYGPRPSNWSAVETLFHAVRTQQTVTVGSLETARRFIHVSDIAEGIVSAIGQDGFQIFNLSGDRLITLREVIEQSALLLDRRPTVVERAPEGVSIRNPDNRKAKHLLGWEPATDLPHGLRSLDETLQTTGAHE